MISIKWSVLSNLSENRVKRTLVIGKFPMAFATIDVQVCNSKEEALALKARFDKINEQVKINAQEQPSNSEPSTTYTYTTII